MTDFSEMDGSIWWDGKLVPAREAKIPYLTHGFHYAGLVFEGIRAYGGHIFALQEHIARLFEGAGILGYAIPYDAAAIEAACRETLAVNGLTDAYLRPAAWRGSEKMGLSPRGTKVHIAIAAWAWPSYFSPEQRRRGVRLTHSRWRRPAPDTAPWKAKASGLYQICTHAKQEAEDGGFEDALMLDYRGFIAEATGSNIFLRIGNKLHTPTPDCFLDGITRRKVMMLAVEAGIPVVQRHIGAEELAQAEEVFLTGTAAEIVPVAEIGAHRFTPGHITELLMERYEALTRQATPQLSLEKV